MFATDATKRAVPVVPYRRQIYVAKTAQQAYEELLVESRSGVTLNKESFYEAEKTISNALRNGQHIYHAVISNNVSVSVSSVYRYIKAGYYSIGLLDLPRAVKFKSRNEKKSEFLYRIGLNKGVLMRIF